MAGADFAGMATKSLEENVFVPALEAIDKQFSDQPLVQATLQQTLAVILRDLALYDLALAPQQAAMATRLAKLGEDHLDTLETTKSMSSLLRMQGKHEEAEALLLKTLDGYRKVCGDDDIRTLRCQNLVAVLRSSRVDGKNRQNSMLKHKGFRRALGEDNTETLEVMSGLASALTNSGNFDEAEKLLLEAIPKLNRLSGADSTRAFVATNNLGAVYLRMNRLEDAERYYRLSLDGLRRTLGDLHPTTIYNIDNIGGLLMRLDRIDEARVFAGQALKSRQLLFGDDNLQTLRSVHNMAVLSRFQKKYAEAETNYRKAYEGFRRLLGPDRPDTLIVASNLGIVLRDQKKYEEAEEIFRLVMDRRATRSGRTIALRLARPSTWPTCST